MAGTPLELSEISLQTLLISFEGGTSNSHQIFQSNDPETTAMQLPEGRVLVAAQEGDAARRRGDGRGRGRRRRRGDGQRRYGVGMPG